MALYSFMNMNARDQRMWQAFQQADSNGSGQVSAQELQKALQSGFFEKPFNFETIKLMIRMFDTDYNFEINFQEFKQLFDYLGKWMQIFQGFDRDRSGSISFNELSNALHAMNYNLSQNFMAIIMKKVDRQRRGQLSFDDFLLICLQLQVHTMVFRRYDVQNKGSITLNYEQFLMALQACI